MLSIVLCGIPHCGVLRCITRWQGERELEKQGGTPDRWPNRPDSTGLQVLAVCCAALGLGCGHAACTPPPLAHLWFAFVCFLIRSHPPLRMHGLV